MTFSTKWTLVFFLLLVGVSAQDWLSVTHQTETKLLDTLLKDYDPRFRAISPTYIYTSFSPLSLNTLDIGTQQISLTGIMTLAWIDPRLSWNPDDYDGLTEIMVPFDSVWTPTAVIQNSVGKMLVIGKEEKLHIRVINNTVVVMSTPLTLNAFCEMKILAFPFDTQKCLMKIVMWGTHDKEVTIFYIPEEDNWANTYDKNGEWDLLGQDKFDERYTDSSSGRTYTRLSIGFTFKRKWVFLTLTLMVPAILNSLLMSAVFALPFECGEKVTYALTVLLTYIVLLTLVASSLPPISIEISVLQIYLTGVMCTGTVATLLTCWTVTIYNKNPDTPVPQYLISVVQSINNFLCTSKCCETVRHDKSAGSENERNHKHLPDSENIQRRDIYTHLNNISPLYSNEPRTEIKPNGQVNENGHVGFTVNHHSNTNGGGVLGYYPNRTLFLPRDEIHENTQNVVLNESGVFSTRIDKNDPEATFQNSFGSNHKPEPKADDKDSVTWMKIAKMIDTICLKIISSIIFGGTVGLIIFFAVIY